MLEQATIGGALLILTGVMLGLLVNITGGVLITGTLAPIIGGLWVKARTTGFRYMPNWIFYTAATAIVLMWLSILNQLSH